MIIKAKLYKSIREFVVNYINKEWHQNYEIDDIVGIELTRTALWVQFNEKDYTKEVYPIMLSIICSEMQNYNCGIVFNEQK